MPAGDPDDDLGARLPGSHADLVRYLAALRKRGPAAGLSQGQLARKAKISTSYLSEVLRGKKLPSADCAEQIARVFARSTFEVGDTRQLAERAHDEKQRLAELRQPAGRRHPPQAPTPVGHQHALAPAQLHDREADLDRLRRFCTDPGAGPYLWLTAPPFAGKSALLAWFLAHQAQDIPTVSFFVNGRLYGRNDRTAFLDAVVAQLAVLPGMPPPDPAGPDRDRRLPGMLAAAAEAVRRTGRRLILVIDGLDEDPVLTGQSSGAPIVTLLPARPPDGLGVVLASRPYPDLTDQLAADHALRDPAARHHLTRSPHARTVEAELLADVRRLLTGDPVDRQVVGLLVAAGGGLSSADLAELADVPAARVDDVVHGPAGRALISMPSRWRPGVAPDVHLLGHDELQREALARLPLADLRAGRRRLHDWADGHRARGWPADTPEYLLVGYPALLRATARDEPDRLREVAIDAGRHRRLRGGSGPGGPCRAATPPPWPRSRPRATGSPTRTTRTWSPCCGWRRTGGGWTGRCANCRWGCPRCGQRSARATGPRRRRGRCRTRIGGCRR